MEEIQTMRAEMRAHHELEKRKIEDLNRWRWLVMGGVAVITWLAAKAFSFTIGGN
jgi:hypothetical protein